MKLNRTLLFPNSKSDTSRILQDNSIVLEIKLQGALHFLIRDKVRSTSQNLRVREKVWNLNPGRTKSRSEFILQPISVQFLEYFHPMHRVSSFVLIYTVKGSPKSCLREHPSCHAESFFLNSEGNCKRDQDSLLYATVESMVTGTRGAMDGSLAEPAFVTA